MRFRKLRIAFSATCIIACLLLIVLWVRSYWRLDGITYCGFPNALNVTSQSGNILLMERFAKEQPIWSIGSTIVKDPTPSLMQQLTVFYYDERPRDIALCFPHLLLVLAFACLAIAPWVFRRFTMRNLLVLTAVIAAILAFLTRSQWT